LSRFLGRNPQSSLFELQAFHPGFFRADLEPYQQYKGGGSLGIYLDGAAFLDAYRPNSRGCLLVDALMPGMSGIALIERVKSDGHDLPAIVITGSGAVPMAVKAMKAGAVDFHREAGRSARSAREHPTRARSDARHSGAAQIAGRRSEKRCESDQPSTPDIGPSAPTQ
jgi:DNA-binding NtrC family response regulator